jgi:hypothetical protein
MPHGIEAFNTEARRFLVFLKNTDQKRVEVEVILSNLQRHAPNAWAKATRSRLPFVVYSMGAGNGRMEIPLIKRFADTHKTNLSVFCDDISPVMRKKFMASAEAANVAGIVSGYRVIDFEDPAYTPPTADLSISSHVWYYLKHWASAGRDNSLLKFQRTIRPGGAGVITLYSARSDRYKLLSLYHELGGSPPEAPSEEVERKLVEVGIAYAVDNDKSFTNMSSCFEGGRFFPNEVGRKMLSFIFRTDWNLLPEPTRRQLGQTLTKICDRNGSASLEQRDTYIWLSDSSPVLGAVN